MTDIGRLPGEPLHLSSDQVHTGVMVALYPTKPEDLTIPGGEPADQLHVTLAFLGHNRNVDRDRLIQAVQQWCEYVPRLTGVISGLGYFTEGEKPVSYWSVDIPLLPSRRQLLIDTLREYQLPIKTDHGFTPHMTIAYAKKNPTVPKGYRLSFGSATISYGDEHIKVPFTGKRELHMAVDQAGFDHYLEQARRELQGR